MNLSRLQDKFPAGDIEWRVSRAGIDSRKKIYCKVLAYITARAIQYRLDDVCGPAGWKVEEPRILEIGGKPAFAVGISIHDEDEWITKWDVCEPTKAPNIDAAKGGFSGAMKRAGAQWGIGRYLYYLDENRAKVSDSSTDGWRYARLSEKHGGGVYYWQPPRLPEWALPKENEVSKDILSGLVLAWRAKFAPDVESAADRREGFSRFVGSVAGDFPIADIACWTLEAIAKCQKRIEATTDPKGPDASVPFGDGEGE